jgi:enoyl-CoA hydratase
MRRNALRASDWDLLRQVLGALAERRDLRCLVIQGAGSHFCAGSDLSTWAGAEQATIQRAFGAMEATFRAVEDLPIPVIAAVRGAAVGAGCQLALACDLRVVAADALIGMPTARLGILPTAAFAARLAGLAGPGRARELLYTGRLLDGPDAAAAGLAEFCVPGNDLDATVGRVVADIIRQPRDAIAATKAAFTALHPVFDPAVRLDEAPTVLPEVMAQAVLPYLVDPR